tara:strand:- start:428 stop:1456 length:1029 start_codon:yes stop_codon:yes gene_type:complete
MDEHQISSLINHGILKKTFPGAVALIVEDNNVLYHKAFGNRMVRPKILPMETDTIFDLASLTKPIVISTLIMKLVEMKLVNLDEPVQYYLPEVKHNRISILDLLTHRSGYPAWTAIYLNITSNDKVLEYLGQIKLTYETGKKVIYSCLGYILLGILIERTTDMQLDQLTKEWICDPLQMTNTFYNPPENVVSQCAATEDSNSFERQKADKYQGYDWRDGVIIGKVHDENANYLNGVSGNAGLFSTTWDLGKFCQMLIDGGRQILNQNSINQISNVYTKELNSPRGIGWVVLKDKSLYHTGFTGTAIRLNLKKKTYEILLTNRVHPDASNTGILEFRDKFYNF